MVRWRQLVRELNARIELLEKENDELKRRLLAYENAHTPPSLLRKKRPPKQEPAGKLGAPIGHPRYERKEPEPTGSIEYVEEACPHCNVKLGKPFKTVRKLVEEIPEPQPIEVIEHFLDSQKPKCLVSVLYLRPS